jgi:hypothetical protein
MVTFKLSFNGSITKVPQFGLEKGYIKNTPYVERSEGDDIPFWACTPFHLEYVATDKEHLDQILAGMIRSKQFQALFGKAAFYHRNPGLDASGSKCSILGGVLMCHIAMVRSINKVPLRGISHPDCHFPLTRYDEKPRESEFNSNKITKGANDGKDSPGNKSLDTHHPDPRLQVDGLLQIWYG